MSIYYLLLPMHPRRGGGCRYNHGPRRLELNTERISTRCPGQPLPHARTPTDRERPEQRKKRRAKKEKRGGNGWCLFVRTRKRPRNAQIPELLCFLGVKTEIYRSFFADGRFGSTP